jgi:hypothetical protein
MRITPSGRSSREVAMALQPDELGPVALDVRGGEGEPLDSVQQAEHGVREAHRSQIRGDAVGPPHD